MIHIHRLTASRILFALSLILAVSTCSQASAATFTVTNTNDAGAGSLRQAVLDANASAGADIVDFSPLFLSPQTITLLTGDITITDPLSINGPGASLLTVSGNHNSRIFAAVSFGPIMITGMTLTNGNGAGTMSSGIGGAMYILNVSVTIRECTISGNTAGLGGAVVQLGGTTNFIRTTISNNVSGNCSGVYMQTGIAYVDGCTFTGNSGTGIADVFRNNPNNGAGTLTITNSTFSGNSSTAGNSVVRSEGEPLATSTISMVNCTVTNNTVTGVGQHGAIWQVPGPTHVLTLVNTIVSGNLSGGLPLDIDGTAVPSSSNNLIGAGGGLTNGVNGNLVGINNPQLAPLQNNGGPTMTHALLCTSPALDAGTNAVTGAPYFLTTDQRGGAFARLTHGRVDIGAYEAAFDNPPVVTTQPANQSVQEGTPATFASAASGIPSPTVQWQRSTNGGTTWSSVPGATNTTYTFVPLAAEQTNLYRALFASSTCATVASDPATLSVGSSCRYFVTNAGSSNLYEMSPYDFTVISTKPITMAGYTVQNSQGMSNHPATLETYVILQVQGQVPRMLAKLNLMTGKATLIGNTGDKISGISFSPSGVLYGVTGEAKNGGTITPEALFTLNLTTGLATFVRNFGAGDDGEAIAFNSTDGLLYHASGYTNRVWESYNTGTNALTNIPVSGYSVNVQEILGMHYVGGNSFLVSSLVGYIGSYANEMIRVTSSGERTFLKTTSIDRIRGMVSICCTPSMAPVVTVNPVDQNVPVPGAAIFSASASGAPPPTVQWQQSNDGGSTWNDMPGQTSTTLVVPQTDCSKIGMSFRAGFTNLCGANVYSNPASIIAPDIDVPVASHDYGLVVLGTWADYPFTIANTGTAPLVINTVSIGGADASEFSVQTAPTSPVPSNGSTVMIIRFTPATAPLAIKTATVSIANDDPCGGENPSDIAVSGYGIAVVAFTNCPDNIVTGTDDGVCKAAVAYASVASASIPITYSYVFSGATTASGSGTGSGESFAKGETTVVVTATDGYTTATCTFTVTVNDDEAPVPDIASLPTAEGECSASVTAPSAMDNCAGPVTGTTTDPTTYSAQGTYTVHWSYSDGNGNSSSQTQTVVVHDVTAPVVTLKPSIMLWPPNHQYATVSMADMINSITDNCVSLVPNSANITSVSSDEPEDANGNGDGNTVDDIVIAADCHSVQLRSERDGTGNGRVYRVNFKASDGNGNSPAYAFLVRVPHNQNGPAVDDGPGAGYTVESLCGSPKQQAAAPIPAGYALEQNYPNPFNPATIISYTIPQDAPVTLAVYDIYGQKVAVLVDGNQSAGQHSVSFNASGLTSGTYLYTLESGGVVVTKTMNLLK